MTIITLLFMVLMHIIEDFHVQGIMAQMKQKSWWYDQFAKVSYEQPDKDMSDIMEKYGKDYLAVLFLHGFEWSMFIHIPIIVAYVLANGWGFSETFLWAISIMVCLNAFLHAIVDDLKANALLTNLIQDQLYHLVQIGVTYTLFWTVF